MALRHGADGYPQPCPPELWATSKAILCRRHRLFAAVIHLIANDDWRNMAQCSILHSSPPTPLKELDLTRPQLAGFFWSKFWLRHRFRFRFRRGCCGPAGLAGESAEANAQVPAVQCGGACPRAWRRSLLLVTPLPKNLRTGSPRAELGARRRVSSVGFTSWPLGRRLM